MWARIALNAVDPSGNNATAAVTVMVSDSVTPTISMASPLRVALDSVAGLA